MVFALQLYLRFLQERFPSYRVNDMEALLLRESAMAHSVKQPDDIPWSFFS